MPEILLSFNEKNFEYDVYTLVKAFFPQAKIAVVYEDEESGEASRDMEMHVRRTTDSYVFAIREAGKEALSCSRPVPADAARSEQKNALKQLVYTMLRQVTGRELPWGDLTGIRPVRIPMDLLEAGWKNADIARFMRETYFTNNKKTALAIAVANREKDLLSKIEPENGYSLYVGIPFCPSICLYCSFGSHPIDRNRQLVEPYLEALHKELEFLADAMKGQKLTAVYIGGGTPTSVEEDQLKALLEKIGTGFNCYDLAEYTVEAGRPDTVTPGRLAVLKEAGVSRISINPQTMNQKTLDRIGRRHTVEQTIGAFDMARSAGFDNINMDLIAGLPGEGPDEMRETLEKIEKMGPDSLTIHSLALKRSSRLNYEIEEYSDSAFHNSEEIMEMAGASAARMNMHPYYLYRQKNIAGNLENVGYAREGCFGIYNILIMEEKQNIMACGAGAITKFVLGGRRIERVANVKDVRNYIDRIDEMIERKRSAVETYSGMK